jgi:hypothetical protein
MVERHDMDPIDHVHAPTDAADARRISTPVVLSLAKRDPMDQADLRARYTRGEFSTTVPFDARPPRPLDREIAGAIAKMKERDRLVGQLPGIDCGACGAPSCGAFAEDVVRHLAGFFEPGAGSGGAITGEWS